MNDEARETMTMIASLIVIFFGFPVFLTTIGSFNNATLTLIFLIFWILAIGGLGYKIKKRIKP